MTTWFVVYKLPNSFAYLSKEVNGKYMAGALLNFKRWCKKANLNNVKVCSIMAADKD